MNVTNANYILDEATPWRMAVMGGAYGNVPALKACVEDAIHHGCRTLAFIGDAIGCCGHGGEILELIRQHFSLWVAGNHEQQAAAGQARCACGYSSPEDERTACDAFAIAQRGITDDQRRWLAAWPDQRVVPTPAGQILLCHGSPDRTNEFLYESEFSSARWLPMLKKREWVGFVCTHTGLPWMRRLGPNDFAMNCGVTGKPDHDGDTAVHYALLEAPSPGELRLSLRSVGYDHAAWAQELRSQGIPEIFVSPLETGVWTTGVASLPELERKVYSGRRCSETLILRNKNEVVKR